MVLDAERKYPNLCENKSELITRVTPLILAKLQNFRTEPMVLNMLQKYEDENSQVQTLLAITLLPFLFTPTTNSKKRKLDDPSITSCYSKAHAYRLFFSNFETNEDLSMFKTMINTDNSLRIYTVGNLKENPITIIQLFGIEYILEDPIKAFQVFFKLFFALNLDYPPEAYLIWTFVERFFYEMEFTADNNAQMRTYINEFKIFAQTSSQKGKIDIVCNLCSGSFDESRNYISHYKDHWKGRETLEYICCNKIFGNVISFGKHLNQTHGTS